MGSPYTWPRQNDTGPTTNRAKYLCDGSIGAGRASFIVSTDGAGRASLIASTDGAGRASFVASTDGAGPQSGGRTVAGRVGPGPLGKP